MRVLHVIEAMDRGGAEAVVVEHVRHAAPGVEVHVCALNRGGPALDQARQAGAHAFVLDKRRDRLGAIRRLAGEFRSRRIEVVNGHNPIGGLYATLAARLAGTPVVRTEHSIPHRGRGSWGYGILEPIVVRMTARTIAVCETVRRHHTERHRGAARQFVTVMNGVSDRAPESPRAETRAALGLGSEPLAIAIGSLTPQKDHATLLAAFAVASGRVPSARLAIAGKGGLATELAAQARQAGLESRVSWLGDREDVAALLEAADVFVLSSRREGLPLTLLEAMRASRPAVCTAAGGTAEALSDGETGRLVAVGDPVALGEALAAVLADPALASRFGAAARRRWAERFTAARMVRETEAVYRTVLGTASSHEASPAARPERAP